MGVNFDTPGTVLGCVLGCYFITCLLLHTMYRVFYVNWHLAYYSWISHPIGSFGISIS